MKAGDLFTTNCFMIDGASYEVIDSRGVMIAARHLQTDHIIYIGRNVPVIRTKKP